jgi:hypothetical protein
MTFYRQEREAFIREPMENRQGEINKYFGNLQKKLEVLGGGRKNANLLHIFGLRCAF